MKAHHTLLAAVLLLGGILTCATPASAVTWIAGTDLAANEQPDGPQELINPNPTVPQWSYGHRSTILGTSLTLWTPAQHGNDISGYTDFDGWGNILVNAGINPIIINNGPGPLLPLNPGVMYVHSGATEIPVVRWTAPAAGSFSISAFWQDIDHFTASGSDGASGNVIVNGVSIFGTDFNNGGSTSMSQSIALNAGDTVDFVLGMRGNIAHDGTAFNATIIGAPEPSRALLLMLGLAGMVTRRQRKSR